MQDSIVICDDNKIYSQKLFYYLSRHASRKHPVYLFHSPAELDAFGKIHPIGTLLLSENFCREKSAVDAMPGRRKIMLTQKPSKQAKTDCPFPSVHRYQRTDRLCRLILLPDHLSCGTHFDAKSSRKVKPFSDISFPAESVPSPPSEKNPSIRLHDPPPGGNALPPSSSRQTRLVAFYSPVHRVGQTTLALHLARQRSAKDTVLYINLRAYPEYRYLPGSDKAHGQQNIGDLLYFAEDHKEQLRDGICSMMVCLDRFYVLMPIPVIEDLKTISMQRWIRLLDILQESCLFDTIILDLGDCVNGLYHILSRCSRVYTHYTADVYALEKLQMYEHNLVTMGLGDVIAKTVRQRVIQ